MSQDKGKKSEESPPQNNLSLMRSTLSLLHTDLMRSRPSMDTSMRLWKSSTLFYAKVYSILWIAQIWRTDDQSEISYENRRPTKVDEKTSTAAKYTIIRIYLSTGSFEDVTCVFEYNPMPLFLSCPYWINLLVPREETHGIFWECSLSLEPHSY